jgi:ankyrin repeat protein
MRTRPILLLSLLAAVAGWGADRGFEARNEDGMTRLMIAAASADAAEVRRLVREGAQVDARVPADDFAALMDHLSGFPPAPPQDVYWTAIVYAGRSNCIDCAKALLEAGAKVNDRGRDGSTALLEAARQGNRAFVELLVAAGADAKDPRVIHAVVRNEDNELLRYFLARGANPDALFSPPRFRAPKVTPLLVAIELKNAAAVRILLEAGASAEPRNPNNNWSALRVAEHEGLTEIEDLLRRAGAKEDREDRSSSLRR